MLKKLFISGVTFIIISCNNHEAENKNEPSGTDTAQTARENCYQYIHARDTIDLKMMIDNGAVTGTLAYNLYEKDKNKGTIKGTIKDDVLIAEYSFMSEGKMSTRQVAFKRDNNFMVEGYGPITEKDNKMVFSNPDSLTYNNSIKLTGINCSEIKK